MMDPSVIINFFFLISYTYSTSGTEKLNKYKTEKGKFEWRLKKYKMIAPCNCIKNCYEKISVEVREKIFKHFVELTYKLKNLDCLLTIM